MFGARIAALVSAGDLRLKCRIEILPDPIGKPRAMPTTISRRGRKP
jgi:hypothetical protein